MSELEERVAELEAALQEAKRAAAVSHGRSRVAEQLAAGASLSDILHTVVRAVESVSPGLIASVQLVDDEAKCLRHGAAPGLPEWFNDAVDGLPIGPGVGSCGAAAYEGERVIVSDVREHPNWADFVDLADRAGIRASWSEPIKSTDERVLGTFAMYYRSPKAPEPGDIESIQAAADLTSIAIERSHAGRQLAAREERLRRVVDTAHDAVIMLDTDGRVVLWNRQAEAMFGWNADEVVGEPFAGLIVPAQYLEAHRVAFERAARGPRTSGVRRRLELAAMHRSGREFPVEISVSQVSVAGGVLFTAFITDTTERHAALEALKAGEAKYRTLVEHASDGIFVTDPDLHLIEVNPAGCALLGYDREELLQFNILDLLMPEDLVDDPLVLPDLEPGQAAVRERRIKRKDGTYVWVEVNACRLPDQRCQGIVRDVTGRREAEERRQRLHGRFLHSQKLESLGVLAGGIAHDFNNLLVGVLGNADLALMDLPADSPLRDHMQEIEKAALRASELTQQMLAYSGRGSFRSAPVDVNVVLTENRHLLRSAAGKTTEFDVVLAPKPAMIKGDASQLGQVVINLVTNGAEALAEGAGKVTVSVETRELTHRAFATAAVGDDLPSGDYVCISVNDTGTGMDADVVARVFDPFFSTKFTGRGLGLAVVLGIVRGHGGALLVDSIVGVGTTFTVVLPVHVSESTATEDPVPWETDTDDAVAEATEPVARPAGNGRGTVLVVDDDHMVRRVARKALETRGYSVVLAEDGVEGVARLRERSGDVYAVLLDWMMPRMSGRDAFERMRREFPKVPVVVMSGYPEEDAARRFPVEYLAGFLQKPFLPRDLAAIMERFVDGP